MPTKQTLWRVAIFGGLGLLMEVFFTAISELLGGNINMHGKTSPWMLLDYCILGVAVGPISTWLIARKIPLPGRAVAYMLGIFLVEYVSGLIFVAFGLRIWDYSHLAYNLHGQITLLYAPFWFGLGLVLEPIYRRVDACAKLLAKGV
jgi:uncharacterized membrane protein